MNSSSPNSPAGAKALLSAEQVSAVIDEHFPQANADGKLIYIEQISADGARLRLKLHDRNIRPGGTISGPAMFLLADVSVYAAILAEQGEAGLQAVTTNLTINFLSRPQPADLISKVRLIKLGRRLAVGEVELYSEGKPQMVAHATATYAIPPQSMIAATD